MLFSTDRDLLALEPNLFTEAVFASQHRLEVADGAVSDTSLTSATADFEAAQIDTGDIVLISDVPCEVIERVSAAALTVSKLRDQLSDAAIPPGDGSSITLIHRSFGPQAKAVHDVLLARLGIDVDDPDASLTEDAIVSLGVMARLETLGTLARVYAAAIVPGGEHNAMLKQKADDYRRRFDLACRSAVVLLDLDGDGRADASRDMGVIELHRV
ncbi:MAG: hypothetical protein WD768_02345 [Phycisphaeraceae bacterium]